VSAVPTFLIDRRYVVQGAQDAAMWTRVIDEIAALAAARQGAAAGAGQV
jgi:predicted DsbA family dithiol-disulfide isomerase